MMYYWYVVTFDWYLATDIIFLLQLIVILLLLSAVFLNSQNVECPIILEYNEGTNPQVAGPCISRIAVRGISLTGNIEGNTRRRKKTHLKTEHV